MDQYENNFPIKFNTEADESQYKYKNLIDTKKI